MGAVNIAIQKETRDKLEKRKHPGQSYDGVIREMLEMLKDQPVNQYKGQKIEF